MAPSRSALLWFSAALLVGCRAEDPEAFITSHVDDDLVTQGWAELFYGRVSDDADPEELAATWFLDGEALCVGQVPDTSDRVECEALVELAPETLELGEVELALEVTDPEGNRGAASVLLDVRVSDAPIVEILSPEDGLVAYSDEALVLSGLVSDDLDDPETLLVAWSSDLDGPLATDAAPDDSGQVDGSALLSEGGHTLTLAATDSTGATGSASVAVTVFAGNTEPACAITAPADGDAHEQGETITFTGQVDDFEDPTADLTVTWSSDLDGDLPTTNRYDGGEVELSIDSLSLGTHTITLAATDTGGLSCSDSIAYTVGQTPLVSIDEPLDSTLVSQGETVRFQGTVSSDVDLAEALVVEWSSSQNGWLNGDAASTAGIAAFEEPGLLPGDHTITLTATDSNGFSGSASITLTVNGLPEAPELSLDPDPAYTTDDLVLTLVTDSVDPEGDSVTYTYSWTVDGVISSASTSTTLPSSVTDKDETWEVTVTPNDGLADGETASASLTITNTPPVLASVELTPEHPVEGDTLTCTPGLTTDVDGDSSFSYAYAWVVNGSDIGETTSTLDDSHWGRGASIACIVTPSDGTDDGAAVTSNTVGAENTAPEIIDVTISPDPAQAADTLVCTYAGYTDADGDADQSTFSWTVEGTEVGTTSALSGAFVGGETVTCTVTPDDGTDTGTPVSDSLVVTNTAPSVSAVTIDPSTAYAGDTLTCRYSGYVDDDGDADQSTYSWAFNGSGVASTASYDGDFIRGDVLACTVTPDDGEDTGTPVSTSVTITNSAPSITSVSMTPSSPQAGDTLTCSYTGYFDADGDADASTWSWTIDGVDAGESSDSLSSGFVGGELVVCTITPSDGTDDGAAVSASATIGNTAPTIDTVSISPSSAAVGDTLTCSYTGYDDPDGDPDESTASWTVNGTVVSTDWTLSSDFVGGDEVSCTVTPYDGKSTGTSLSDSLTIDNTPPSITSVTISPSAASTGDTLTCSYTGYADVDGDVDASGYSWTVNGTEVSTSSTLSSDFVGGDTVACTVTPDDGEDTGIALSDSLVVDNTAPSISSVSISPSTAQAADTLTCSYSGYSDPDGNSDQSTFAWTVNGSTVGNSATLSGAFIGHDEVTCTVTPSDGSDDGTALSASITIDNTAPVVSSVTISPSSATTSDALSCSHGGYSDADGDADVSTYAWSINGVTVSTDTTLSSGYVGGDTVTCTVTPDDGEDTGTAVSDSLTIDNTPPAITSVAISPSSASEGDTLTCSYSGFSDADGDSDQSTYSWTVNGTEVETSDTLSGSFVGGDTVACTVTPHDGEDAGTALSDSLTVDNTAPSITSVSISPSTAQAGDTLTCSYTGYVDPDGDTDQSTYSWTVDGTEVGTSDTLSSGFVHGETVTCTVTPSDGSDTGTALSDSLVVVNTAPSITSVSVSPTTAQVGDTLTCTYTGFSDADGETDQSSYAWSINGIDAGVSTDTLSTGFVGGDAVACTVTPHDGTDAGTALSDSVTIANTAPTITSVSISPTSASTGDTLTCSYSGFSDADGDGDASTYSWTVNGTEASTTSTLTSGFVGGDIVTCTVTPHDGEDAGSDVSDSLTIDNTAPSITSVSISPTSAAVGDTLSCSYSGYSDADGDSDASTILWTVGGTSVSTASTLSTDFVGGDTVTCTVTPNDGQDAGTSLSDSLVIDNTAPTITGVSIAPSAAQAGDTLTCSISGFSDPDGDADASTYAWDVNGTAVSTATTLSSGFVGGDTVTCTVTPSDGTDDGIADSASLVIDNTAPSITSVSISPSSPAVTDDLTCSYSGYSDADGDTDVSTYSWTVNGTGVGTTDTLASGSFASGDAVVCTVTPSDGQDTGTEASASVTIGNSAPSITAVSISPSTAQAGDTLTCSYSGYSDADGDTDQSTYRWTINGSTAGTSATLFSGFAGTDAVTCTVTPFDGNNTGTALSDSITISNSAPSVDSVSITPVSPVTGDTLACSYSGYDDPDGDADASTYAWTINGTSAGTGSTLGSGFVGGDTVTCTVTPSDGSDSGTAVSDSVVVDNTAPSITSVTISPSSAQAADTLSCSYSGYSDADGDTDASTYSWTVGGIEVGTSSTLAGAFVGSDVVVCTVTPSDGEDSGTALSDSLTIDNTAPVLADAAISPDPALTDDALTCVPGTATDADGDTITYSYAWSVDGSSTGETTDTLASTHFGRDQLVICTVTPTDGQDAGSAVDSGTLTISNTAPSVSSVTVSPASPDVGETLTCTYGGYSDADGDADASTYSWTILGVEVGTTSTLSTGYAKGDTVTCTVTPHDGDDAGTTVSDSVVIANSAPSISSVSISPSTAQAADELTCTYTGFSDPDSDLDQSTYEWTVNGSVAGASSTLSGAFFGSDTVTCTVTPSDGEDTGTAVSASVTIDNTAPVLASVSLTPTTAYEGDTLTCTEGTATDDDGDAITYSYSWTVDGIDTGTSGASLSSSHFDRGEVVVCSVTPSDPTADGSAVDSNSVTISNTAPVVSNVSISPSSPTVASTLTCTYTYSDADGDADSSTYSWSVGGTEVGTTSTLSTGFSGGDTAVCTVTPNDGTDAGTADSGSVIVDNTAPSITSVSISPTDPTDADDLTCSYSGFSDADGDADSSTYSWTISGTEVGTTDTLSSSATTAGDVVTCTVTPYDGTDAGTVKNDSATITASNSAPVVTSLVLSPSSVQTDDTLTVSYATSDADGDTVTVSYEWYVNGVLTSTTSTLSGSTDFDKNDSVFLDLTPNDGTEDGTTERSSTKIVQNTAPTGLVAAISPATPDGATEDIVCSVDTVPTDADGDTLTYTFTWDADGLVYPDDYASATGPDTTTETNDTIPAADTSFATEWTCTITPNDGDDDGTADDATATVGIDLSGGSAFTSETCTATMSDNAEYAQVFTVASGATVTHIGIGFDTGATGCDSCYFAIYDDDGSGQPGTVLGETNGDCSVSAGGSTEVAFSTPVTLPSGGDYYIGAVVGYGGSSCSTTDRDVPYDCSGSETVWTGQTFGGAFTDPWSTGGAFTIGQWAIWAIGY